MQIREKGRQVICIKTEYVKEQKRTFGRVIAKQDKYLHSAGSDVREVLNDEEIDELNKWLSKRSDKKALESLENSLGHLSYTLNNAAQALDRGLELDQEEAEKVIEGLDRLKKSLRKKGYKLTKQKKKSGNWHVGENGVLIADENRQTDLPVENKDIIPE